MLLFSCSKNLYLFNPIYGCNSNHFCTPKKKSYTLSGLHAYDVIHFKALLRRVLADQPRILSVKFCN